MLHIMIYTPQNVKAPNIEVPTRNSKIIDFRQKMEFQVLDLKNSKITFNFRLFLENSMGAFKERADIMCKVAAHSSWIKN